MSFRFTPEPKVTQHILPLTVLTVVVAVGSTDAFAGLWAELVSSTSPRVLLTAGLVLLHTVVFWPVALAFHYVDQNDRPAFIARHRIQTERRIHPPLGKTVRVLLLNQFVLLPLLLLVFGEVLLLRGWTPEPTLPSLGRLALELIGQGVFAVAFFYASHRFLHGKYWMKRVHRVHHEFKTTTAMASEYAHPVELAVGNFGTLAIGALILAPHLASIYLFAMLALLNILVHHSGYALPWAPWAVHHDWHHYRVREMFGTAGHLDRLLGTAEEYAGLQDDEIVRP